MKLTDSIYDQVKQDVFHAVYKPNELITERQIAEKFGVSKLTAGEVLHRLCTEGHLTSFPRSGYLVTSISPTEMQQLKRLRFTVEALVIEIICAEVSEETIRTLYSDISESVPDDENINIRNSVFHLNMARLTGDKYITNIVETILGASSRIEERFSPAKRSQWQDFHIGIVDALLKRDVFTAKAHLLEDIEQR
jgi:DNA-binding GntR family transcriptional regulator